MKRLQLKANIIDKIEINKRYDQILMMLHVQDLGGRRNIDIKLMRKQKDIEKFSNQQLHFLKRGGKF